VKLSQGVEWGLHCAVTLCRAPEGTLVSRRALAQHFDLPEAYLGKHLKAMVKAGVLYATTGPKGGFRLAKPPEEITVLAVVEAVEGASAPFVCQEIRQRGPAGLPPQACTRPCAISCVMAEANNAWRESLRSTTIADLHARLPSAVRERTGL
jgi:Rrf2 family protein